MEYSKLIHDFLDGTLDPQQENELFMMVSSNDEVRADFKHAFSLDKALNKKLSSFAPSAKSTVGLFTQLGFTAPASMSGGSGFSGKLTSTLKKYSQGIIGAASMAVVSVIVFLLMDTTGGNSEIQNNSIAKNDIENTAAIGEKDIPAVVNFSNELIEQQVVKNDKYENGINTKPPVVINNDKFITQPEIVGDEQSTSPVEITSEDQTYDMAYDISKSDAVGNQTAPRLERAYNSTAIGFVPVIDAPRYDNYIFEPTGLSFEIHGNEYWQLHSNSLPESTVPKFNNMGLTILYDVSDDWSVGVDVRQEHFYQEFTVLGDDGINYQYRQTPNYGTYSVVGKYNYFESDNIGLFAQAMAGMTATGGVGRFMAGAEYSPNRAYTFALGLEYSLLAFKNNNHSTLYLSPKFGFNYSIIFNL